MIKLMIISVGKIYGGIEKYTLDLLKALPEEVYEIHAAVRSDGLLLHKLEEIRQENTRIKNLNMIALPLDRFHFLGSMIRLKKYVKEHQIELLHCNSNNSLLVASLICEKKVPVKKLAVIHGDVVYDQAAKGKLVAAAYKWLEIRMIRRCSMCIAVSQSVRKLLVDRGIDGLKIEVVHNGIEPIEYKEGPDYWMKPLKICSVGNLLSAKDHMTLLKALKILRDIYPETEVQCDIYGEGECRLRLQEYITKNRLKNIRLCGFEDRIRSKLNQYALYIQPSLYESFGIAVLEAMNAGCCVVASRVGGLEEIIDGKSGFFFGQQDYKQLAEQLYKCYSNRDFIEKAGNKGKLRVLQHFTVKKMAERMNDNYMKLLQLGR